MSQIYKVAVNPTQQADAVEQDSTARAQTERSQRTVEMQQAVSALRDAARSQGTNLQFRWDLDLEHVVVTVHEGDKSRVLRIISPDEASRLVRQLRLGKHQLMDQLL